MDMRRIITSLLAVLLMLSLAGCNQPTPIDSQPPSQEATANETISETSETSLPNTSTSLPASESIDITQQIISGDFAIRNVELEKNLRPYNAGTSDGNNIILYPHNEWKCLTWQFNHVEGSIYQLQNVYMRKTFEPMSTLEAGVALWQQPLSDDSPKWEFIKLEDGAYAIKMVDADLYITISSDKTDSAIILMPYENSSKQKWELIEQYPKF